jgi:chemotaxis protein methyltransferase CheR
VNGLVADPCYRGLKNHLIASTGLAFYSNRDAELAELISQRLTNLQLRDCSAYSEFLANGASGEAEMDALIARLTIGETSFFRDPAQFNAIREVILPEILERKQSSKELRIWSAGCATGAEPYSLAIMLANEMADRIEGWKISIHAADLNTSFLRSAADGKFSAWALRSTSDEIKDKCFSKEGRLWSIDPRYKRWISFHRMNLVDGALSMTLTAGGCFDLILCRNVMIYFPPEMNRRLIGQFYQSLEADGWLVVGAAEHNLRDYTAFRIVNATGARLYQKKASPSGHLVVPPKPTLVHPVEAVRPKPERTPSSPRAPDRANIEGLRHLADIGDWKNASEYSERFLSQDTLNPDAHFYRALIFENLGDTDASKKALRQAIYLNRQFALAHYYLGLALKRDRAILAAERSFSNVLSVLANMAADAIVTAGTGVTVATLRELAQMHLGGLIS